MHQFVRVDFENFKAFKKFHVNLKHFNILVGPNNAGKSTILAAFRILASAMRRAESRKPSFVLGPFGQVIGYNVDLSSISIAEENIFYNYETTVLALVTFTLSNKNKLILYFPENGSCFLVPEYTGKQITGPITFQNHFDCSIGFVPILGPVEHHEPLYEKEAARLALYNYRAARNFRNIWYHYPEKFAEFRATLQQTWPGMDIQAPEIDLSHGKPRLHMFCPEYRIPREIFWSGFGFQVWCQMLTHLIQSNKKSIFLIDEPDIYLHSELQRQLLGLLKNLGPDIIIATHSTEIITESETNDILLVNKANNSAKRIKDQTKINEVFQILGSNINPILTQLAKTRRVLFLEGKDFQIIGKFARKLGESGVGNRRDFAVIPVEGFNPEKIKNLKSGMEATLGTKITALAVFDKDYRCKSECASIRKDCLDFCDGVIIHDRKEIENFLLVPSALDRAFSNKMADRSRRSGSAESFSGNSEKIFESYALSEKNYVTSQLIFRNKSFSQSLAPKKHETELNAEALSELDEMWKDCESRLKFVPGKGALSYLNKEIQDLHSISITVNAIIDAMRSEEIPKDMKILIEEIKKFSQSNNQEIAVTVS